MRNIKLIGLLLSVILVSCEISNFGEELQVNPNALTTDNADPNFILNNIQLEFADVLSDIDNENDEIMRYKALSNAYAEEADQGALIGEWSNYYTFLQDAKVLEAIAANNEDLRYHRGMSSIITSYATVVMVDYLGEIPFTEANRADEGILSPAPDKGLDIYNALLIQLDEAIEDMNAATLTPLNDLYYRGDKEKWIKLANSLKLKMLVNLGDVSALNSLIAENNFIDSVDDDFQFSYGTQTDPESRHPNFDAAYVNDLAGNYMGNSFLNLLLNGKSSPDPRIRYYVYRQASIDPPSSVLPCQGDTRFDFCYIGNSYFGRDHGDLRPFSSDFQFRTIYGLYPAGGAFDANNPADEPSGILTGSNAPHAGGAGILPIMLSSYVDFLRAEAALRLSTNDDAEALLESAITKSMTKVLNFANGAALGSPFAASNQDVNDYVAEVLANYGSADNTGKLDIILEEFYIASYGNPTEGYNGYRRTGFPSSLQVPVITTASPFPRTFAYPENAVNSNPSISQKPITTQVFWDTNPSGFIE
ncbi:SusD/RagB family nutrient-binding outer membrane lipoprotein [Hyunsoonleella ulvae]|uniref:SusD/RagB family nutrient-binding outer membrane lipoprotein n=1 Tax=Hyunsoonleella ulvae TaxID=2799948 RepID=UPI001939D88A|nr:SusD/RagB family nutrient-binding outer membrane lipoprotein [Hyunsoonleella ulvae]